MRSLIKLAQITAILFIATTTIARSQSYVADYYNEIQQIAQFGIKHPLVQNNGKWGIMVTTGAVVVDANGQTTPAAQRFVRADIDDMKNGYIEFSESGGPDTMTWEVVFFIRANTVPMIGVTKTDYNGRYPVSSETTFYERSTGRWKIASNALPAISAADFLYDDAPSGDQQVLQQIGAFVYVNLPQLGEHASAYFAPNENVTNAVCAGKQEAANPAAYQRYCSAIKGNMFLKIDLLWNSNQGRYRVGDKTHFTAPWVR